MRKYAHLRKPLAREANAFVHRIMLYGAEDGFFLFEYCGEDAVMCSFDRWYASLEELHEDWDDLIDDRGWIEIDDPLPGCQHDAFIPLRVRGRDTGHPQWGEFETLRDGKWVEYKRP
ncbi:MAG: hypothetical protein IJH78_02170 [Clostridia bacterium]|nr:hypothetical protein [Clostridia bacterium]